MVCYRSIFTCFIGWILFCLPFALLPAHAVTLQFSSTELPAGNGPRSAILVDLDRDGHRDLVVANLRGSNISLLFGDGGHREILAVPGVGSAHRPWVDAAMLERGDGVPVMDGRKVFKLAVTSMPRVTRQVLEQQGYELDDLDLLVMHQANLRINEAAQRALKLPDHRVHNNIQRYGNTTSATLPLCFHEAREAGKAEPGTLVAFAALGAGLHWGAVLMRV